MTEDRKWELEQIRKLRRENERKLQEELQKRSSSAFTVMFRNGHDEACVDILEVLKR